MMKKLIGLWIATFSLAGLCLGADASGFKLTKKYLVPGDVGFDYIVFDSASNRRYVSHGTQVDVLDSASGNWLGKIEDTPGVHGIAIVPDLHRGFTTNGKSATVSVFDTNTLTPLKTSRFQTIRTSSSTTRNPIASWSATEMQQPSPPSIRQKKK